MFHAFISILLILGLADLRHALVWSLPIQKEAALACRGPVEDRQRGGRESCFLSTTMKTVFTFTSGGC